MNLNKTYWLTFSILVFQGMVANSSSKAEIFPVPAGNFKVSIRYFSLKRDFSIPRESLIPFRPSTQQDCPKKDEANETQELPVIEIAPSLNSVDPSHENAPFFPGVLAAFTVNQFHLAPSFIPAFQGLTLPGTTTRAEGGLSNLPTILFLPGLGSQSQFYLTTATALASFGYRVLVSGHPGVSGDLYTHQNCMIPGIDPSVLNEKIRDLKLIDPVMNASIWVLKKDLELLNRYAVTSTGDSGRIKPVFAGHSIGGIAATLFCSENRELCASAINLDGGDYSRYPEQSWPTRKDLPFLKFHSTPNLAQNAIPSEAIGPRQKKVDFDASSGEVQHESFTDVGFFKGISDHEMPLERLRKITLDAILDFLAKN